MPDWIIPQTRTCRIGVLLFDRFSNYCLANAIEPFRAANTVLGWPAYDWRILTLDGAGVASSSGLPVLPAGRLADAESGDLLMVLPSYGYRELATPACARALRDAARRWEVLAGLDTGSWLLAAAGLLDGRRATIHFDEWDAFGERFPEVRSSRERWIVDGDRITAGGATTAFELALHLIGTAHGMALTLRIAALFMHEDGRAADRGPGGGLTLARPDRFVARAIALMQRDPETPLPIGAVARHAGCRQRDLELRFARALGATPRSVYRWVRLDHGRRLLEAEQMSIAEVATRCGYTDASAFARAFRAQFGQTPRAVRAGG